MEPFAPINQNTLADHVTERIREAIIRGDLQPNQRLSEPTLASELGVSRSPVREALTRLESNGLVHKKANRGFFVWEPSPRDVDEIISLRVMMESFVAELIINKFTEQDFWHLEEMVERQKAAVEVKGLFRLTRADREFHAYFVEKAGNKRLLNMWNQIMGQWEILIFQRAKHYPYVPETVVTDHHAILQALRANSLTQLVNVHRKINQRVGQEMKDALQQIAAAETGQPV